MNKPMLSPSMMCVNEWQEPARVIEALEQGGIEMLHADAMDGHFVQNLMMGTDSIKHLRGASKIPLDIHQMIENPENKLGWFGISEGEYVSIHQESTKHLQRALAAVRDFGAHPSVALNPATPLCMIENVLCDVDMVLLMTVNPGFAGQKLVPQTLEKITRLRKMLDQAGRPDVLIQVDGNVSWENAVKMRAAGADVFVCGTSSIFGKGATIAENIARFREILK